MGNAARRSNCIGSTSVWTPIFSRDVIRRLMFGYMGLLCLLVLLLPPDVEGRKGLELLDIVTRIADVRAMAAGSSYPLPTLVAYSLALVGSLGFAVAMCFSTADATELRRVAAGGSPFFRSIFVVLLVLLLLLPYVAELRVSESQRSAGFFRFVGHTRLGLLIWIEGIYALSCIFWMFVLLELTTLCDSLLKRS